MSILFFAKNVQIKYYQVVSKLEDEALESSKKNIYTHPTQNKNLLPR